MNSYGSNGLQSGARRIGKMLSFYLHRVKLQLSVYYKATSPDLLARV